MKRLTVMMVLALSPTDATASENAAPEWLAGYWLSCDGGRQTVESWISDGSGVMVGVNQSRGAFEFMRIGPGSGGISYFASPSGAAPTEFRMISVDDRSAVFSNPAHDFPQVVRYERDGDVLVAMIEGDASGKTQSFQWRFKSEANGRRCRQG